MSADTSDKRPAAGGSPVRMMLVDDSAVIRGALSRILKQDSSIEIVASASNGQMGVQSAQKHKPDIVIMDIEMPVMDGLSALPKILEVSPQTKVIMFSTLTEKGASVTMKAMALGAVECVVKPSANTDIGPNSEFQRFLLGLIRNLCPQKSGAKLSGVERAAKQPGGEGFTLRSPASQYQGRPALVAIGSSTGGPQALFTMLAHCKGFPVPIIVTQHMPATFTRILANHIVQNTGLDAVEGEEGMSLENGKVYVAPGGYHMLLTKDGAAVKIKLDTGPAENFCKPAVDPMLRSAVEIYGNKVLGVILTGMGRDGLLSAEKLVSQGGRLIAQDEKTSVVWGMPGAVAAANLCSAVLPLDEIGPWVKKTVMG